MTSFTRSRWCRFTALCLALALIQTAPGLAAYSALAANLKTAPVTGGNVATPIRVPALGSAALIAPHNSLTPLSLSGSLNMAPSAPVLSAPSNAPMAAVTASAIRLAPAPAAANDAPVPANDAAPVGAADLAKTLAAIEAPAPSASARAAAVGSALNAFGLLFDGRRARPDAVPPITIPNDAPAFAPLAAPADAPSSSLDTPPSPNTPQNAAPGRARVSFGLALAIAGGVGAWYAFPAALPYITIALGWLPFTVPMLPLLAMKSVVTALGAGAGLAAFSTDTWKNFPADLKADAVGAARTTFRFWARFGLIFDAVLRGKPTDDVMKGDVSANILKYPLIAWLFVAVGYVLAPVAFVLGAAWRVVGTPILAAIRGAKEVAIGFFPWLARVFRFLGNVIRNIIPFIGGFLWGAVRGLFVGGVAGAVVLAGPIFRDAVAAKYKPATLPGWVGYRLLQLVGLLASAAVGLAGFVVGVAVSPLHALMSAFERAFAWSDASERAEAFFKRWLKALSEDKAFPLLAERTFSAPSAETLNTRRVRLANNVLISTAMLLTLPFLSLATLVRSLKTAFGDGPIENANGDWEKGMAKEGAERPTGGNPGFIAPLVLAVLGAASGVYGYATLAPASIIFGGALGLAAWAGAGLLGAALGLALSQPSSWAGIPERISFDVTDAGILAWTGWEDAAKRVVSGVLGTEKASILGNLLAFIPALVLTIISGLSGIVYGVASGLTKASWKGFMETVRRFIPALRRFLDWALEVLKNILPFAFGFLWGAFLGFFKTAFVTAVAFFQPAVEAFEAEDDARTRPSEAQVGFGLLLGLTALPLAAAVFAGGLALGATVGLPFIVAFGISKGVKWAKPSDASVAYWRAWERVTLPRAVEAAGKSVKGVFNGVDGSMPVWRVYVRVVSSLLGAIPTAFVIIAAGAKAFVRSFIDARRVARGETLPEVDSESGRVTPERPEVPAAVPAGKPPVAVAAVAGALGLAAGIASIFYLGLPLIAGLAGWTLWAGYAGVFAGLPLLGLSTGLALTQPVFWTNAVPLAMAHGKTGMSRSYEYWKNAADSALESLFGVARGSLLNLPSRVVGGVLGAFWAVGGMLYGAGAAFLTGAYEGARQVVYEILPALRVAFETVMKVLRRIVPFVFGLIAGLVSGVVGSATFGALLLGRPYFKHVVVEDFEHRGALGTLGNLFLKLVSLVLGVLFGLGGVLAGVIAAAPYALTGSVALALRFADIGGPVQRYFDHWSYGALREEMRRINQLTSKFKFDDAAEGKDPSLASGWIRIANILPATIAAVFAATIAGYVSYFRSLRSAYKSSTSGQPIPEPVVDEESRREWDRTWSRAGKTARGFFGWAVTGATIGAAIWMFTSWAPLGLAGWLLVGAAAGVGAVLALGLASVIAMVALIFWISGQLR